ncbi:outer membrane protein assembly factor BamD [Botryobacter ruber]|uniref:outer membrane protein assembly factor BamD n=1 Tax=Botryobacter ruber TaxID=2171629 RepID=UPI000E0BAA2A|nr:outer membrane protein assembly factor BamD [Botryobacter ruber]
MNKGIFHTLVLVCLLLLAAGCSNYQKLLKSTSVEDRYQAALKYYEKEDYYRANQLLEQILPLMGGLPEGEYARYIYANTHYKQREYLLSAYQFRQFYETYPRSQYAEEAMFLHAKSEYMNAPDFEQDQTPTLTAIEAIQEFMTRYPESGLMEEANAMLEDLNVRLDRKAFNSARLYYQLRYYNSAVVALTNFLNEHPASPYGEEAAFLRLDAQYRYAQESVLSKQQERFMEAVDFYQSFIDQYPNSKYLRDAEQVYSNALSELDKLKQTTATKSNL